MKRVVVLGATGTLGAPIAIHLSKCGYEVIAVGHRKSDNGFFEDYQIQYISLDISDKRDFEKLPQDNVYAVYIFYYSRNLQRLGIYSEGKGGQDTFSTVFV